MLSRRNLLVAAVAFVVAACSKSKSSNEASTATTGPPSTTPPPSSAPSGAAAPTTLAPTPSCGGQATEAQTEGPFFKSASPAKSNLAADVDKGTHLAVSGSVLTTACKPVDRAKIEVWQADADGEYDNSGYRLRGHLFTDSSGRYRFETVEPGLYTGRTKHIHVKVQAANGPVLTTQLYFPGEAANSSDSIFDQALLMSVKNAGSGKDATFDFVIRT